LKELVGHDQSHFKNPSKNPTSHNEKRGFFYPSHGNCLSWARFLKNALNFLTLNLEPFFYYGDFWFQVSAFVKIFDSLAQGLF